MKIRKNGEKKKETRVSLVDRIFDYRIESYCPRCYTKKEIHRTSSLEMEDQSVERRTIEVRCDCGLLYVERIDRYGKIIDRVEEEE